LFFLWDLGVDWLLPVLLSAGKVDLKKKCE
jgi:hypothetical protein